MQFHWRRGVVDVDTSKTPRIATKKALEKNRHAALSKEADILQKLEKEGIIYVPQVKERWDWWFSYQWIPGEPFDKIFSKENSEHQLNLTIEIIDKAYQLDMLWIVHGELDRPMSNILVHQESLHNGKLAISIIDFERGVRQDYSGKNLRHILQWLHRTNIISLEQCKSFGKLDLNTLYSTLRKMVIEKHGDSWVSTWSKAVLFSLGLFLLDQLSKWFFYDLAWWSESYFLTPVFNTGIWRSLPLPLRVTILAAGVISGGVLIWMKKQQQYPWRALFLLAGARWNGYDRIFLWWVRDFIDVHYRPIFNGADIYLTLACLLLLLSSRTWSSNSSTSPL